MRSIKGEIAWVTGAGTGIGEAAALALAADGAKVILTGRRAAPLEDVARRIKAQGGTAEVRAGDLSKAATVDRLAGEIRSAHGRLDILVSNAGLNIPDRSWKRLTPEGIDTLVSGNLSSAIYVARACIPIMREQGGGVMIHTSSWAGRWVGAVAGPIYTAAKHGVVAMSHSINLEECQNNIRSSVVCPGEVATPIMKLRDPPEPPEIMAR
ncbi:MAG TPA: SDR family oxidoreductase, partial [Hyphomicrobiaceae bacterium]|nr:SDR family oxidoreductase [Hyphomicrobiaceae bacterium]